MRAVALGLAGALLLHVFYANVRDKWPENYATARTSLESSLRVNMLRYMLFRLVPVYLAGVFVAVTTDRLGADPPAAVITLGAAHLATTNGRAFALLLKQQRRGSRFRSLILFHLSAFVVVLAALVAAALTHTYWTSLIPLPRDVVTAVWTGLFAALLALASRRVFQFENREQAWVEAAKSDIGTEMWDYAAEAASRADCDVPLIKAILVTEASQRPRWVRRLEDAKAKVVPGGTYGIAQMENKGPLTDRESIDLLAQSFAGYYPEREPVGGGVRRARMEARLEDHNQGAEFLSLVMEAYLKLEPYAVARSPQQARDHRPLIEVTAVERRGELWRLSGTAIAHEGSLVWTTSDDRGLIETGSVQTTNGAPTRGDWTVDLPLSVRDLWVSDGSASMEGDEDDSARTLHMDMNDPPT